MKKLIFVPLTLFLSMNAEAHAQNDSATTNSYKVVQCDSPEVLKKSIDNMLEAVPRLTRRSVMNDFFKLAYTSRSSRYTPYNSLWGYSKKHIERFAGRSAAAFLNDGRMDDQYQGFRGNSRVGRSTVGSYNLFLEFYCFSVEGMDAKTITARVNDKKYMKSLKKGDAYKKAFAEGRTIGDRF